MHLWRLASCFDRLKKHSISLFLLHICIVLPAYFQSFIFVTVLLVFQKLVLSVLNHWNLSFKGQIFISKLLLMYIFTGVAGYELTSCTSLRFAHTVVSLWDMWFWQCCLTALLWNTENISQKNKHPLFFAVHTNGTNIAIFWISAFCNWHHFTEERIFNFFFLNKM